MKKIIFAIAPIVLLAAVVALVLAAGQSNGFGTDRLVGERPPIEDLKVVRIRLRPNVFNIVIFNDGPDPVEISQVLVNGSYWAFEVNPAGPVQRMRRAEITIEYPWNTGDDQHITLVSSSGVTFPTTVPAAVQSPDFDIGFAGMLALIGFLIGVVPVLLGLLWFPFVRTLSANWYRFFMALTVGLLVFLGIDSIHEALELLPESPSSIDSVGVLFIGFFLSFLLLFLVSRGRGPKKDTSQDDTYNRRMMAFSAALGIGIHNLGEGLAVGSAFAIGNLALGATLIVGFMIHNVTEALPIVTPLAKMRLVTRRLVLLGLLAGAPAIAGTLIGGFAFSPIWSVFFLGIGAGAIFQVAIEVAAHIGKKDLNALFSPHSVTGFMSGLVVMYATGLIIVG